MRQTPDPLVQWRQKTAVENFLHRRRPGKALDRHQTIDQSFQTLVVHVADANSAALWVCHLNGQGTLQAPQVDEPVAGRRMTQQGVDGLMRVFRRVGQTLIEGPNHAVNGLPVAPVHLTGHKQGVAVHLGQDLRPAQKTQCVGTDVKGRGRSNQRVHKTEHAISPMALNHVLHRLSHAAHGYVHPHAAGVNTSGMGVKVKRQQRRVARVAHDPFSDKVLRAPDRPPRVNGDRERHDIEGRVDRHRPCAGRAVGNAFDQRADVAIANVVGAIAHHGHHRCSARAARQTDVQSLFPKIAAILCNQKKRHRTGQSGIQKQPEVLCRSVRRLRTQLAPQKKTTECRQCTERLSARQTAQMPEWDGSGCVHHQGALVFRAGRAHPPVAGGPR